MIELADWVRRVLQPDPTLYAKRLASLVVVLVLWLLRLRGAEWVACSGVYKDLLILSVRTRRRGGAGPLAQRIVGQFGTAGGHGSMAGGQIALSGQDPGLLAHQLNRLALEHLGIDPTVEGTSVI